MAKTNRTNRSCLRASSALVLALAWTSGCEDENKSGVGDGGADTAGGSVGTDGGSDAVMGDASGEAGDTPPPPPVDTDLALVRFNADGKLDMTFGTAGIVRLDLSSSGGGTVRDSLWGLTRDAMDRLVLFGAKKADTRADSDRVVVRLTGDGARDMTFATMGVHTLDVSNLGDNIRHGFVQADGKIVSSGYTPQPTGVGTQVANKVVLLRLNADGTNDATFGTNGIVNSLPFMPTATQAMWGMAEAYGVVAQGDKYVTAGYGRTAPMGTVDMVSFRYSAAGMLDATWGTNGSVVLDVNMGDDRGRNLLALPDGRVLVVGTGVKGPMTEDALVTFLGANGAPDTTFDARGYKLYEFDGVDEEFYGVALAPNNNWAAISGYSAAPDRDDDSTLVWLPISAAAGAPAMAKKVPLSDTGNDRLFAVTVDPAGKAVAAGFVNEGGDNHMVVARFNPDGTLDGTFGTGGFTKVNVSPGKTEETARGVVVRSDGKIVIAGVAEH